jgi:hypothetical protein
METKYQAHMLVAAVIGGLVGGAVASRLAQGTAVICAQPPAAPEKVLRAETFEVLDKDGKVRATLTSQGDEGPTLRLLDTDGEDRVVLSLHPTDEAVLAFRDKGQRARLSLALLKEGPRVDLWDPAGKNIRTAWRTAADGAPLLELYDQYMRRRAVFGLDAGDQPGLSLEDTAGKARLTLGLEQEGLAVLRFLSPEQVARIGLSLGAEGGPASLSFHDPGGQIRALLALGPEGGPVLTFLDASGQGIWRAP